MVAAAHAKADGRRAEEYLGDGKEQEAVSHSQCATTTGRSDGGAHRKVHLVGPADRRPVNCRQEEVRVDVRQ